MAEREISIISSGRIDVHMGARDLEGTRENWLVVKLTATKVPGRKKRDTIVITLMVAESSTVFLVMFSSDSFNRDAAF